MPEEAELEYSRLNPLQQPQQEARQDLLRKLERWEWVLPKQQQFDLNWLMVPDTDGHNPRPLTQEERGWNAELRAEILNDKECVVNIKEQLRKPD